MLNLLPDFVSIIIFRCAFTVVEVASDANDGGYVDDISSASLLD